MAEGAARRFRRDRRLRHRHCRPGRGKPGKAGRNGLVGFVRGWAVETRRILFAGSRHEIRARAAQAALLLLHRRLSGLTGTSPSREISTRGLARANFEWALSSSGLPERVSQVPKKTNLRHVSRRSDPDRYPRRHDRPDKEAESADGADMASTDMSAEPSSRDRGHPAGVRGGRDSKLEDDLAS